MRSVIAAAAVCLLLAPGTAHAGLIGTTMSVAYDYPDDATVYSNATYSPSTFVIGSGVDTVVTVEGVTTISADFADAALHLVLNTRLDSPKWSASSFNGLIFTVLSGSPGLTGADVTSTTMTGFGNSRVALSGDQIRIDWNGLSYEHGTVVNIDFRVADVPEPASLTLLVSGVIGAGVLRRRHRAA